MASTAATMMGNAAGSQPAMTALIASFSSVACRHSGGIEPSDAPAVAPAEHRGDALGRGGDDGQPVAPRALGELGQQPHRIVVEHGIGLGDAHHDAVIGRRDRARRAARPFDQAGELLEGLP